MAQPSVKIKGINSILAKVDRLVDVDMTHGMNKVVALVQGSAKLKAPADTGDLQGSISKQVTKRGKGIFEGKVFTNLEYAPYVEFGTGAKGDGTYPHKTKGISLTYRQTPWAFEKDGEVIWTSGQVAQPYMYPALLENKKAIKKILETEYKRLISKGIK